MVANNYVLYVYLFWLLVLYYSGHIFLVLGVPLKYNFATLINL